MASEQNDEIIHFLVVYKLWARKSQHKTLAKGLKRGEL